MPERISAYTRLWFFDTTSQLPTARLFKITSKHTLPENYLLEQASRRSAAQAFVTIDLVDFAFSKIRRIAYASVFKYHLTS